MRESHGNPQALAFVYSYLLHSHMCGLLLTLSVQERKFVRRAELSRRICGDVVKAFFFPLQQFLR